MHVGMCAFFQNLDGQHTDREVYQHELAMADLAEPLGFESIWAAEHHFTPYDMCPSTTQFRTFRGRTYVAAVSPESAPIVARLQLGVLIIPQKPWDTAVRELGAYRALYRELNRSEAPPPLIASFVACHEDEERAREMLETHVRRYCRSTLEHYEFANAGLATVKGYEYYGALARNIEKHGEDRFVQFLADLQVWGTPDQVYERICEHQRLAGSGMLIGIFSYGGMPHDQARRNIRLFAEKVLPRVQALAPRSPFHAA